MSDQLFTRVQNFIAAANLDSGYQVRFFRWLDSDIKGRIPMILIRRAGRSGISNRLLQQIDVQIMLVDNPTNVRNADTRMQNIMRLFRGSSTTTGVVKFEPIGEIQGPIYLENDRPCWTLNVRCYVEDQ
jgi:hypothetical protein